MTLQVASNNVYSGQGVAISVTGIAQVKNATKNATKSATKSAIKNADTNPRYDVSLKN